LEDSELGFALVEDVAVEVGPATVPFDIGEVVVELD
jgi:hypothetical protein